MVRESASYFSHRVSNHISIVFFFFLFDCMLLLRLSGAYEMVSAGVGETGAVGANEARSAGIGETGPAGVGKARPAGVGESR